MKDAAGTGYRRLKCDEKRMAGETTWWGYICKSDLDSSAPRRLPPLECKPKNDAHGGAQGKWPGIGNGKDVNFGHIEKHPPKISTRSSVYLFSIYLETTAQQIELI